MPKQKSSKPTASDINANQLKAPLHYFSKQQVRVTFYDANWEEMTDSITFLRLPLAIELLQDWLENKERQRMGLDPTEGFSWPTAMLLRASFLSIEYLPDTERNDPDEQEPQQSAEGDGPEREERQGPAANSRSAKRRATAHG